jgi:broad specificity phosphatase PhoE
MHCSTQCFLLLTSIIFEILHQGHLDAELNDIGRQQAVAVWYDLHWFSLDICSGISYVDFIVKVAHRLSKEAKPAAIYSSDLKRAAETAQTIARICNLPNVCAFYSSLFMLCEYFSMMHFFCTWKYTTCGWFSCF